MDRILKPSVTADTVGLSLPHLYKMAREGRFPRPVKVGPKASGFLESEVKAFMAERIRERDQVPAGKRSNPVPRKSRFEGASK